MITSEMESEVQGLRELIEVYGQRLYKLRMRVALEGRDARPADLIEIEDIKKTISNLEQQRREIEKARRSLSEEEARRFAQKREAIETELARPLEIRAAFSNRDKELDSLIGPRSKPFVIVNAPAGYGKSYLLREAQRRLKLLENKEKRREKWITVWIECQRGDTQSVIVKQVAHGVGYAGLTRLRLEDLVVIVDETMDSVKADGLALFFDDLDRWKRGSSSSPEWLPVASIVKQCLLVGLNEAISRKRKKLAGFFAGRYVGDWAEGFPLPYLGLDLSPFSKEIVRVYILETVSRWQEEFGTKVDYTTEELQRMAEGVLEVTGGHTGAIAKVIQNMADDKRFAIILGVYFSPANKASLFQDFVSRAIGELLEGLPPFLQEAFRTVSIFRGFNESTLDALLLKEYLKKDDLPRRVEGGWNLYRQMLDTHLVEPASLLSRDKVLQRVLSTRMRFEEPNRCKELHGFAVDLYDHWLQGQDHQGQPFPSGLPAGADQIVLMLEGLYHLCWANEGDADRSAATFARLEAYLRQLRYPFGRRQGADALRRAIVGDEDLPGLLRKTLGEGGYSDFLARIQQWGKEGER